MTLSRVVVFLSIVGAVFGAIHYYLWARLVRDVGWPAPTHQLLTVLLIALGVLLPLSFLLARALPLSREVTSPLMWVLYTWMGLMFCLFVLLLPADLVRGIAWIIERLSGHPIDPERRLLLARLFGGAVGLGGLGMAAVGLWTASRPVAVKPVEIPVRGLPAAFAGFRIVQLTDVHVGPTIGREFIERLVARTNALEPDLVAITGDLVDGSVTQLGAFIEPLRELRARHGVYFVTGNHEYFSGADEWIARLRELGVTVLRNERAAIERDGAALDLAGIDDPTGRSFADGQGADLPRARRPRPRAPGDPPRPPAAPRPRGRRPRRRPAALRPHPRRPDLPLQLPRPAAAAVRRRPPPRRRHRRLRQRRHRLLGPADARRHPRRDHRHHPPRRLTPPNHAAPRVPLPSRRRPAPRLPPPRRSPSLRVA
jgi:uncharacterized protein